jgi:lipopolysaccharide assembly protein A
MVRRIILPLLLFAVLVMAVLFAALNPGAIDVDFGLFETRMQKSLALSLAFAAGWIFGILCLAVVLVRMVMERRRLRKALRLAEAEVHTLRSMPAAHAD